jgi:hypothetical protein
MLKRMMGLGVALAVLGGGSTAWAGYKDPFTVSIDSTNRVFMASMGGTRNTSDSFSFVEVVFQGDSVIGERAFVAARNSTGQMGFCIATSPSILSALKGITDDAYLEVHWDANLNCTSVDVRANSYMDLKAP